MKVSLYDSRVEVLEGNRLLNRPWFLAKATGVDGEEWVGPGGVSVVGWFHSGHEDGEWGQERCWRCLVDGRGSFRRFDGRGRMLIRPRGAG